MSETIPHWLTKQADLKPNETAIEFVNGSIITFKELSDQSQCFARQLAFEGVSKGDHVGILSGNHVTMIIAIHALSYLGAVGVLLNTRLSTRELQYQIDHGEVSVLLVANSLEEKMNELHVKKKKTFSDIQNQSEKEVVLQTELTLNDPFTIIFTSGTTGFPKGVIHTYGNHWWSAIGSALNLGLSDQDKWLAVLPFFHVSGLSTFLKSAIYGMPVYLMEKFDEQMVHDAIMHKGVTIISVVTVMVQRLLEKLGTEKYPETFRCMLLGGGPAPKPMLEEAKELGVPVFQSYGLTETSSQIATLSPKNALDKLGSAGKPLIPAQLKIKGKAPMEVGEIHVKGPMVTKGYFKNPNANDASFDDGWLQTGDLGYLDEEGFLYMVDRRSDLIISGGENIYPSEIESVLSGMDEIKEIGVTGKKDDIWGEVPVAFIVMKNEEDLSKEEIVKYATEQLASYKVPKEIHFVEYLPRNASNKIMRHKLVEWL